MSRWINVEDRLPIEEEEVLVKTTNSNILIEKITNPKDGNLWSCVDKMLITHWMELPKI